MHQESDILFSNSKVVSEYNNAELFGNNFCRAFGLREEYAEIIQLCRNCRCLFWKSIGHPCIADKDPNFMEKLQDVDKSSLHVPIPPQAFLTFFSL